MTSLRTENFPHRPRPHQRRQASPLQPGGQGGPQATLTSRLHVMPFLSMTEKEFGHPKASLLRFGEDRVWRPSEVLAELRRYITEWNARHDDPCARIVGVIIDSATTMAGLDGMDGEATTNFFFYLGRLCEALGVFFTIIGHVPKAAFAPRKDPWGSVAARLRRVTMWRTTPRMAVEVRLLQEWREGAGSTAKKPTFATCSPISIARIS